MPNQIPERASRYFKEVLWEAVSSSLEGIGHTWQGFIFAALILLIGAGQVYLAGGWEPAKANLYEQLIFVVGYALLAWLPFLLVHIVRASYTKWKQEYEMRIAAESALDGSKPQLAGEIKRIYLGSSDVSVGDFICLGVRITNDGLSTNVGDYQLQIAGTSVSHAIDYRDRFEMRTPEGITSFDEEGNLLRTTGRTLVQRGEIKSGFLIFRLSPDHVDKISANLNAVILSFKDYLGNEYFAELQGSA